MDKPLSGSVALVTGSGRGLGRAIATRLAQLGADLAVHDQTSHAPAEFGEAPDLDAVCRLVREHGTRTIAVVGDVSDEHQVATMVREVESTLGPIDILVNAAGGDIAAVGGKPDPNTALGIPVVDLRAVLDRNLVGTMLACREVCPAMCTRQRGSVINIASVAAHLGISPSVAYAVAKAGVVHYTRCLAAELRAHHVRVNVVSPGPTRTARFLATRQADPSLAEEGPSLARYALPEEVADAVAFLAGEGSRFVNGQVLRVDGGRQLFPG